jgi:integrase
MGTKQNAAGPKCPRGVSIREGKLGTRIQIAFSFRGTECRELLPPGPVTQTAINLASGLRAEIARKIASGVFVYSDYFPDSPRAAQFDLTGKRVMLSDRLQAQLEIYERQVANGQLSPSTYQGYAKAIASERMAHWQGWALASVKPSDLRAWIGGIDTTAKFIRNLITPLRSVFEDALNDDLIEVNPFDRIAMSKLLKQTAKTSDYEVDPFNADERAALIKAARADEAPLLRFWFATGLRPGELMALKWTKLDQVGNKARIDANQVAGIEKGPKTEAGVRDVDLSTEALAGLASQKPASLLLESGHVWLNPRTAKPWETDAQLRKTLWLPLCARAGVRYRNPYQVRHTFASALLTAGHNPWYVAQQLGHVDVQMVFRIYGKFIAQDYQKPQVQLRVVGQD